MIKIKRGDRQAIAVTRQFQNLTVEIVDLLFNGLARLEQRTDHSDQLGTILDQFLGPHGKDIELGTADHETDVLEQAADLVLEITLDFDQQRPARQQRPNRMAIVTVGGETSAAAAMAATATIPIVFNTGTGPVKLGLVTSLAQPGGNATGVNIFTTELVEKRPKRGIKSAEIEEPVRRRCP